MRIYILRHGRTEANERKLYAGASDWPVSASGLEDLKALGEAFDYSLPEGAAIYTSGMRRTEDTLRAFYGDVPHEAVQGLMERNFGVFENKPLEEISRMPEFSVWMERRDDYVIPGGESFAQLKERVLASFNDLISKGRDFMIVIHGGPIGVIMSELFPGENREFYMWQPENGKGYVVTFEDGKALSWESFPPEER